MATPVNIYKTPQRTPCSEFKTPVCPPSTSTPFSYSNLSYSSFVKKNRSFGPENRDENQISQSTDRFILNRRLFDPDLSNFIVTNRRKLQFNESKENADGNAEAQVCGNVLFRGLCFAGETYFLEQFKFQSVFIFSFESFS